jgi:DNA-binding GntR family transcriptional regulator
VKQSEATGPLFPEWLLESAPQDQQRAVRAYVIMRRAIIEMVLAPGSAVNERRICEELGISRTPLREALLKLHDEALVEIAPNTGTRVSRIDLETVFEGHLVRSALEMQMVRLAAQRMTPDAERELDFNLYQQQRLAADNDHRRFYEMDEDFHALITRIGASGRVWRIIHSAKAQLDRVRRLAFPLPDHLDCVLAEHEAIVAGLKDKNIDRALEAMDMHLSRVFEAVRSLLEEREEYFSEGAQQAFTKAVPFTVPSFEAKKSQNADKPLSECKPKEG